MVLHNQINHLVVKLFQSKFLKIIILINEIILFTRIIRYISGEGNDIGKIAERLNVDPSTAGRI